MIIEDKEVVEEKEKVGIAEHKIAVSPKILACLGLGSCVGVCFYDPKLKLGGLAHILLPDSTQGNQEVFAPGKYVDTALKLVLEDMTKGGAEKRRMWAKVVGGASMFHPANGTAANLLFTVGERNVIAVRGALKKEGVRLIAEEVGGNTGRSIDFYTESGKVVVRNKIDRKEI